jgi:uncharacterized protein YjbI with pentapeptide repeats
METMANKARNLHRQDLHRRNFTEANLRDADLTDANLNQASVIDADFTNATVTGAHFDDYDELAKDATLHGVDFEHARFGSAK